MAIGWWLFLIVVLILAYLAGWVRIVRQGQVRNVERVGRYNRTAGPGLHFLWPFEQFRPPIDVREQAISIRAPIITHDNVDVYTETAVFIRVDDARKAAYQVQDYHRLVEKLTATVLRNVVADMTLEVFLISRQLINSTVHAEVDATARDWGVVVTRLELMAIDLPQAIKDAMEGRQGEILRAEGQAKAIDTVFRAIHEGHPDPELLAYQYLQMLPRLAQGQGNTVVVLPSELAGALKAVGSAFGQEHDPDAVQGTGDGRAPGTSPAAASGGTGRPAS